MEGTARRSARRAESSPASRRSSVETGEARDAGSGNASHTGVRLEEAFGVRREVEFIFFASAGIIADVLFRRTFNSCRAGLLAAQTCLSREAVRKPRPSAQWNGAERSRRTIGSTHLVSAQRSNPIFQRDALFRSAQHAGAPVF